MPGWDGIKTARKIGELVQKKTIPEDFSLIFISGNKFSEFKIPQFPFIKGFYQKPITFMVIKEIIASYYTPDDSSNQ